MNYFTDRTCRIISLFSAGIYKNSSEKLVLFIKFQSVIYDLAEQSEFHEYILKDDKRLFRLGANINIDFAHQIATDIYFPIIFGFSSYKNVSYRS